MKNKRYLKLALILALATPLAACGNKAENKTKENKTEMTQPAKEESKEESTEEATNEEEKDGGKEDSENSQMTIHDLKASYLPEGFGENFKDEKNDLITVEYGAPKNPAKKITVQISNNEERMAGL